MWLRTAYTIATASRRGSLGLLDSGRLTGLVWPGDLDINVHVNNGRYLSLADLGRLDWFARTGLLRAGFKRGWSPVIATGTVRFSRPLKPFQRYELRTHLMGWEDKWAFMEHRFFANNRDGIEKLFASVVIKGAFVGKVEGRTRTVAPQELMNVIAGDLPSPEIPAWVHAWQRGEDGWRDETRSLNHGASASSHAMAA